MPFPASDPRRASDTVRRTGGIGRAPQGLALAVLLVLAACSSTPRRDGPPAGRGPTGAPDAAPRVEPIRPGGPNKPYTVLGRSYVPMTADLPLYEEGLASWYGTKFHGGATASGEPYDMNAMTAAHRTMPIPSYARVRNPANGREVVVRINDRGPFVPGRVIDLSYAAAVRLGVQKGVSPVEVRRITFDEIRTGAWPQGGGATGLAAEAPPAAAAAPPVAAPVAAMPTNAEPARPVAADDAPVPAAADARGFWLQLGAFSRSDGAASLRRQVASELSWLSPQLAVFAEGGLHRLQAGPYASRQQADVAAERVRDALQLVPVIVERR